MATICLAVKTTTIVVVLCWMATGICVADAVSDLQQGRRLCDAKDYAGAVQVYSRVVSGYPDYGAEAQCEIAICYMEQRKFPEAIAVLKKAAAESPKPGHAAVATEIVARLAECYALTNDLKHGMELCDKLIAEHPEDTPRWQYLKSIFLMNEKKYREAAAELRPAFEKSNDPKYRRFARDVIGRFAGCYWSLKDWPNAAAIYEGFAKSYPEEAAMSHYRAGICYSELQQYSKAIDVLKSVLDNPRAPMYAEVARETMRQLAGCYWAKKDWQSAASIYVALAKAYPEETAESYYKIGACNLAEKEYDDAVSMLKKAIDSCNNKQLDVLRPATLSLATAYQLSDKVNEAVAVYQSYIKRFPDDEARGQIALGQCYAMHGMHSKAVETFKKAVAAAPKEDKQLIKAAKDGLGWAYLNSSDRRAAAAQYAELLKEFPEDSNLWFKRIECFRSSGEAQVIYDDLLRNFSDIRQPEKVRPVQ